jgi:hypothetical protein
MSQLRIEYDQAQEKVRKAKKHTMETKAHFDDAVSEQRTAENELKALRKTIDQLLSSAIQSPKVSCGTPAPDTSKQELVSSTDVGVNPSVKAIILLVPRDGEISRKELAAKLAIADTALNNRIQKAKKIGLLESAGWGLYQLTDDGKKAYDQSNGQRLKLVPPIK